MYLPQLQWLNQFPETAGEVCSTTDLYNKLEDIEKSMQALSAKIDAQITGQPALTISKDGEISITDKADLAYPTTNEFLWRLEKLEQSVKKMNVRLYKVEQAVQRLENELL